MPERIAVDSLDKDNRTWAKAYVARLEARLEEERGHAPADAAMIAYLEAEIATYTELLERAD